MTAGQALCMSSWRDRDNQRVPAARTAAETAERLRRRYPSSRVPRPLRFLGVGVLAAVFLGWVFWTASVHASPAVSGQVLSFRVLSDREISVTLSVDRPDPSRSVTCHIVAQASDFSQVGSVDALEVGPRPERVVDVTTTIKTLRRATSASVNRCTLQ